MRYAIKDKKYNVKISEDEKSFSINIEEDIVISFEMGVLFQNTNNYLDKTNYKSVESKKIFGQILLFGERVNSAIKEKINDIPEIKISGNIKNDFDTLNLTVSDVNKIQDIGGINFINDWKGFIEEFGAISFNEMKISECDTSEEISFLELFEFCYFIYESMYLLSSIKKTNYNKSIKYPVLANKYITLDEVKKRIEQQRKYYTNLSIYQDSDFISGMPAQVTNNAITPVLRELNLQIKNAGSDRKALDYCICGICGTLFPKFPNMKYCSEDCTMKAKAESSQYFRNKHPDYYDYRKKQT